MPGDNERRGLRVPCRYWYPIVSVHATTGIGEPSLRRKKESVFCKKRKVAEGSKGADSSLKRTPNMKLNHPATVH